MEMSLIGAEWAAKEWDFASCISRTAILRSSEAEYRKRPFIEKSAGREVSTTTGVVTLMASLLKDKHVGKYIVPIVPDESRTFGMDPLFKQCGIYAHTGQLYEPVDMDTLLYYKEAKDGQILERGTHQQLLAKGGWYARMFEIQKDEVDATLVTG